jgi:hypothetical protein
MENRREFSHEENQEQEKPQRIRRKGQSRNSAD